MAKDDRAERVQHEADDMGMNEDDERRAEERKDKTGEPVRDSRGKESGSS
jgi:hypothetical protein